MSLVETIYEWNFELKIVLYFYPLWNFYQFSSISPRIIIYYYFPHFFGLFYLYRIIYHYYSIIIIFMKLHTLVNQFVRKKLLHGALYTDFCSYRLHHIYNLFWFRCKTPPTLNFRFFFRINLIQNSHWL